MAARKEPKGDRVWAPDKVRERIKTALLVKALTDHVLQGTEMNKSQVTAALGLLKKTLPDLQAIQNTVTGPGGGPVMISSTDAEL